MPFQTFAHGGAIGHRAQRGRAMDRPGDDGPIIIERPNERMLIEKRQGFLKIALALQQVANGA